MESQDNTSSICKKNLEYIHKVFQENGWSCLKNKNNWTKFGDETSFFEIKMLSDKINVCVPIRNSAFQYLTSFDNLDEAIEYVEDRFFDYNRQ